MQSYKPEASKPRLFLGWACTYVPLFFTCCCLACCCLVSGCGKKGMPVKVVYGTVSVGDQPVELGQVVFVPIENTKGPASYSPIEAGNYRVQGPRGGVPLGTHRVEVVAKRKTGRKVRGRGGELIDEGVPFGSPVYDSEASPLHFTLDSDSSGEFTIEIPAE